MTLLKSGFRKENFPDVLLNQSHWWRPHQFHDFALVIQTMITALEPRRLLAERLDFFNMK
jgi:hypothetical protein